MTNEDILKQLFLEDDGRGYVDSDLVSTSDINQAMDLARKDEAVGFQIWVRKNYSIVKGEYRHRGDFYKNTKPINESELYTIFKQQN